MFLAMISFWISLCLVDLGHLAVSVNSFHLVAGLVILEPAHVSVAPEYLDGVAAMSHAHSVP